jgi:hypothetical protein
MRYWLSSGLICHGFTFKSSFEQPGIGIKISKPLANGMKICRYPRENGVFKTLTRNKMRGCAGTGSDH